MNALDIVSAAPREVKSKMVKRCLAEGCSNVAGNKVSLFKLPKDEKLRDQWIKQVQRFRAEWTWTPYSVLCSEHFSEECFEPASKLAAEFGMQITRRLKPDAIPTIFSRPVTTPIQLPEERGK